MKEKIGLMLVIIKEDGVYPTKTIFDLGEIARKLGAAAVDAVFEAFEPPTEGVE